MCVSFRLSAAPVDEYDAGQGKVGSRLTYLLATLYMKNQRVIYSDAFLKRPAVRYRERSTTQRSIWGLCTIIIRAAVEKCVTSQSDQSNDKKLGHL